MDAGNNGKHSMPNSDPFFESKKRLLGEILTRVTRVRAYCSPVVASKAVLLEREQFNLRCRYAIRVRDAKGKHVGYLSTSTASWLAHLLDVGKVRIAGYIPPRPGVPRRVPTPSLPVVLSVFISEQEDGLLDKKVICTRQDVLHQVVFQAYQLAHQLANSKLVEDLAHGLKPLVRQNLYPETHLLIALLPGIANEHRVARELIQKAGNGISGQAGSQ